MGVSPSMWKRGWQIDCAKMRDNARFERDMKTKEITQKWRDGFANLKAENDRLQKERDDLYHQEMVEIDATYARAIAQGPPPD